MSFSLDLLFIILWISCVVCITAAKCYIFVLFRFFLKKEKLILQWNTTKNSIKISEPWKSNKTARNISCTKIKTTSQDILTQKDDRPHCVPNAIHQRWVFSEPLLFPEKVCTAPTHNRVKKHNITTALHWFYLDAVCMCAKIQMVFMFVCLFLPLGSSGHLVWERVSSHHH